MDRVQRRSISSAWFRVAEETLEASNQLRTLGYFRSSVSRSYYAAYSFLAAALVLKAGVTFRDDREGPEHEPLFDLVASHLKGAFANNARAQVWIGIRALYEARCLADYRPRVAIGEALAVDALQKSTAIANNVRKMQL